MSSSYVKLTKEQAAPTEDITPGELNQPIHVPQLNRKRCLECQQELPDSHNPPQDEPWMTGICGCAEDPESCKTGLFCPCVLYGKNMETLQGTPWQEDCAGHSCFLVSGAAMVVSLATCQMSPDTVWCIAEGLLCGWCIFAATISRGREQMQKKFHLEDSPCDSCWVHTWMHPCAICQEHREMKRLIIDVEKKEDTVIDPPSVQEMSTSTAVQPGSSSS